MPFFHTMENFFAIFPHNGKLFSTVWKISARRFRGPRHLAWRVNQDLIHPRHKAAGVLLIILLQSFSACSPAPRDATLTGETMGTTYSIRIVHAPLCGNDWNILHKEIRQWLANVNGEFSAYLADSKISQFNRAGANKPVDVSPDFQFVVRRALEIAEATGGAFDPTVGALVNLWGFGPDGRPCAAPSADQIAAARALTGWLHLAITAEGYLVKDIPALQLDLGAIAKGFGVDQVARLLRVRGCAHFLVEIGGETLAEGLNAQGEPWRVGVLRPDDSGTLQGVARLTDGRAIATSGDYRNFYRDENGELRAHIVDPRTAAPIGHAVASVSVLAADCTTADALATALFVLGPDEGIPLLAARFPDVEALFILRAADGRFTEKPSPGWNAAARYENAGP